MFLPGDFWTERNSDKTNHGSSSDGFDDETESLFQNKVSQQNQKTMKADLKMNTAASYITYNTVYIY